jgi:hypothetical protein
VSPDHDPFNLAIEAWLDESDEHEDPETVLDRVIARLDAMPQGRAWWPNGRAEFMNRAIGTALATAAVVVIAVVGISLLARGGPTVGGPGPAELAGSPSSLPTLVPTSTQPAFPAGGLIGLPPRGAVPSTPEVGELVDSYFIPRGGYGFAGYARLYADGRLIWSMRYPTSEWSNSTGYLEQRLTPEAVELVHRQDPLRLPELLPSSAWVDETIRPYVPSRYAVCHYVYDWDPALVLERPEMLSLLPATAAELLRGQEAEPPVDYLVPPGNSRNVVPDCLALTTEDARLFDEALRAAGIEPGGRYVLSYELDGPGETTLDITLEPIFPDGTVNCSGCG